MAALATVLALGSALSFGLSDFVGGILSKTRSVWMVATASQLTAAIATAVVALVTLGGDPRPEDFAWGAAAGLGGAVGISFLYRGLSRGRMGVVAPISGTGAALVPVVVGLATGDKPSALAWVGIVIASPRSTSSPRPTRSSSPPSTKPPGPRAEPATVSSPDSGSGRCSRSSGRSATTPASCRLH